MNGTHETKKVLIEPKLLGEDKDMLEDLLTAAINDAVRKVAARTPGEVFRPDVGHEFAARNEAAVLRRCAR